MSVPTIVYSAVAIIFAFFGLGIYVLDLRAKVKRQMKIINEQRGQIPVSGEGDHRASDAEDIAEPMDVAEEEDTETGSIAQDDELDSEQKLFVRICQYLYEKRPFTNPDLRMEDLARDLGTNRTTLGSCVRKYSVGNLTTLQLVNHYRLRYAEKLLSDAHSELNVSQVADASGFRSRSTFNRQFFLFFGCSPTDYRERSLSHAEGVSPSSLENTLEK